MNDSSKKFTVSIIDCFTVFWKSFNRVQYFLQMANTISEKNFPKDWIIFNEEGLDYSSDFLPNAQIKEYYTNSFKLSLHNYLVRDCVESFAISLEQLFLYLLAEGKKGPGTLTELLSKEERKVYQQFCFAGLTNSKRLGKAEILSERFSLTLSGNNKEILSSLNSIRNCLAHSNGYVRAQDGDVAGEDGKKRVFLWKTLAVWSLNEETGETKKLVSNEFVPPGLAVQMGNTDHSKTFSIGELLNFSTAEAYEIAMSLHMVWLDYIDQFSELRGLPRNNDIPRIRVAYDKL